MDVRTHALQRAYKFDGTQSERELRKHGAFVYISTNEELSSFCDRISKEHVVAVDTEFLREKTYFPKLCLIQVGTADEVAAIDPILVEDLSPLAAILSDTHTTKVFHACTQDLEVILEGMGCACSPVFDTQVGAAFLGMRQQASYGALVEQYEGVRLAKTEALTDWSMRPLDPEQLSYAEDDVRYLPAIYERMISDLVEKDRLSWVIPEMDAISDPERVRRDPRDAYLKLKRSSSLTRRQLSVAREVCAWREESAARRDLPRKWVVPDEVVVEICKRTPVSVDRLHRIRGTEQLSERDATQVVHAVERGMAVPPEKFPKVEHHSRPSGEVEGILDLMYAMTRVVSEKSGIAAQLIATRDDLADFVSDREGSRLSTGWRHDLVGAKLERLLAGEIGLTIKDGHIEVL